MPSFPLLLAFSLLFCFVLTSALPGRNFCAFMHRTGDDRWWLFQHTMWTFFFCPPLPLLLSVTSCNFFLSHFSLSLPAFMFLAVSPWLCFCKFSFIHFSWDLLFFHEFEDRHFLSNLRKVLFTVFPTALLPDQYFFGVSSLAGSWNSF